MSTINYSNRRKIVLLLTIISGVILLYTLHELFPAFLGAVVLYVLFRPLYSYLRHAQKWPNWLATWTIMITTFLLLVLPLITVVMMIGNKLSTLLINTEQITGMIDKVQVFFGMNINDDMAIEQLISFIQNNLFGGVSTLLNGVLGTFFTLAMMYFMLYFMLINHHTFEKTILKYMPFNPQNSLRFGAELRSSTYSNVLGQGFIAFVQGSLVSLGFIIFNLTDPLFWGVICFFLSFLPIIGAPIVFVPAGLIAIASGHASDGYGIMLWGFLLVINIDNVIRYFISKYIANTHPLISIIGVVIGIPVFGILGLVFGPLLISWFFLLLKIYEEGADQVEDDDEILGGFKTTQN